MEYLVKKYSSEFVQHGGDLSTSESQGNIFLITGTTGTLGCFLLAEILGSASVVKVYALNRPGTQSLRNRQRAALEEKSLDPALVDSPKLVLLESNALSPYLGLQMNDYSRIQAEVTHIIHNGA